MTTDNIFSLPTQYKIEAITIDGIDVIGLFQSIEIFESIYSTAITGTITIFDTDYAGFIEKYEIEFLEPFSFTFSNALGEVLQFDGYLSGLRNEVVKQKNKLYAVDFVSQSIRNDDENFITKRYKEELPEDIIDEMVDIIDGDGDKTGIIGRGEPMNFLSTRRKPTKVMSYVCNHASDAGGKVTPNEETQEGVAKGTGGFLCWQTLDGYRFCSIAQLKQLGNNGENYPYNVYTDYEYTLANQEKPLEDKMLQIIQHEFPKMADYDEKRKSGANNHKLILFDIDKGEYIELESKAEPNKDTTKKQAADNEKPTRIKTKIVSNEMFNEEQKEEKEVDDTIDQTRKVDAQALKSQTTFDDQHGRFTLAPRFSMRAGDAIDVKIRKTLIGGGDGEEKSKFDEKHSGLYVIRQVGHHMFSDGTAYTKIQTLRSLDQQDDDSANEPPGRPALTTPRPPRRRPLPNSPTSRQRGNRILFDL